MRKCDDCMKTTLDEVSTFPSLEGIDHATLCSWKELKSNMEPIRLWMFKFDDHT